MLLLQFLVGMGCEQNTPNNETIVAVLSDRAYQRWRLSNNGNTEQLIYEDTELLRKIREMMLLKFWNIRMPNDNVELDMHFLDFHLVKGYSYILVGAVNQAHTPQMYYAISKCRNVLFPHRIYNFIFYSRGSSSRGEYAPGMLYAAKA